MAAILGWAARALKRGKMTPHHVRSRWLPGCKAGYWYSCIRGMLEQHAELMRVPWVAGIPHLILAAALPVAPSSSLGMA